MGLFRLFFRLGKDYGYCAFCKAERTYPSKKHLSAFDVAVACVLSLVLGGAIWELFDPRSLVLFALSICVGELFVYLRWRQGMDCRYCGFDPVLYNVSPNRAREKVSNFYQMKIQSPNFMLSKSPLLELYKNQLLNQKLARKIEYVKGRQQRSLMVKSGSNSLNSTSSETPNL
ncbi:hypothetical protein GW916_12525 [bacterium]|nr:hypothetical protein [bacterium]